MFVTHVNSTTLFLSENKNENIKFDNVKYEKLKKAFIDKFSELAKFFSDTLKKERGTKWVGHTKKL